MGYRLSIENKEKIIYYGYKLHGYYKINDPTKLKSVNYLVNKLGYELDCYCNFGCCNYDPFSKEVWLNKIQMTEFMQYYIDDLKKYIVGEWFEKEKKLLEKAKNKGNFEGINKYISNEDGAKEKELLEKAKNSRKIKDIKKYIVQVWLGRETKFLEKVINSDDEMYYLSWG